MSTELTVEEVRLAEQYVRVLDYVSRCALAIEGGNWHYLRDKAHQLKDATSELRRVAEQTWRQASAGTTPARGRPCGGCALGPPLPRRPAAAPRTGRPPGG